MLRTCFALGVSLALFTTACGSGDDTLAPIPAAPSDASTKADVTVSDAAAKPDAGKTEDSGEATAEAGTSSDAAADAGAASDAASDADATP